MVLNKLIKEFSIFMSSEERKMLTKLSTPHYFNDLDEHEQYVVECLIRKSLVVRVGEHNPRVIANEL